VQFWVSWSTACQHGLSEHFFADAATVQGELEGRRHKVLLSTAKVDFLIVVL